MTQVPNPADQHDQAARSLDVVQRAIVSGLVGVVLGAFAATLAAYVAINGDRDLPRDSVIGLWVMSGVIGLMTAAAILVINRRAPWSPWVLLGLLPMAVAGLGVFR